MNAVSRSIGTLSTSLAQVQKDVAKSGGASGIEDSVRRLSTEMGRLETALKEHMSGHVGVLSESLVGRGGFWKGIWLVIGVQAAGWVLYEMYRNKKYAGKKMI